jgi:hypothetical protein
MTDDVGTVWEGLAVVLARWLVDAFESEEHYLDLAWHPDCGTMQATGCILGLRFRADSDDFTR